MSSPAIVLVALCALSFATGCPPQTCTLNGVEYAFGETFDAPDGCNECVCAEGGAISCTEIGCSNEPDVAPDGGAPDAGNEPDVDAGTDAGAEPDVIADAGADAGAEPDGVVDGGEDAGFDAGTDDDAGTDAGDGDDDGGPDAGDVDGGLDAGPTDAGPEPLRDCVEIGQFNDNLGQCVCGTNSERPIDQEEPNNFECSFGQCVDNCCSPDEMVDPNDITRCVPKAAPYIQFFALAPVDDIFHYRGYAPGADSCVVTGNFANEAPYTQTFETASPYFNAYPGTGQLFRVPMDRNRFLFGGTMSVECTGEFGTVGETIVIPPADERYSMNIDYPNGVFEFCVDTTYFPTYVNCEATMGDTRIFDCLLDPQNCRAAVYIPEPETGCYQAYQINSNPEDGDIVHWSCMVETAGQNDILRNLSLAFDYDDSNPTALTLNESETGPITYED